MIVQVIGHNVRVGQLSTRVAEIHGMTKGSVPTAYNTVLVSVAAQQRQVPRLPIA